MIFSIVCPISGTEWKDKESGTKVVQGNKRVHFKCITLSVLVIFTIVKTMSLRKPFFFDHLY